METYPETYMDLYRITKKYMPNFKPKKGFMEWMAMALISDIKTADIIFRVKTKKNSGDIRFS